MTYDTDMRGVLFRNEKKRDGKKDPDYRGNATVSGVNYWLDAWINEPKAGGQKYLSIKLRAKDEQPAPQQAQPTTEAEPFDDAIPF